VSAHSRPITVGQKQLLSLACKVGLCFGQHLIAAGERERYGIGKCVYPGDIGAIGQTTDPFTRQMALATAHQPAGHHLGDLQRLEGRSHHRQPGDG